MQQNELRRQIAELNAEKKFFKIILLLENEDLDFSLSLDLVRAYINAANQTNDPYSLFEKAELILDQWTNEGKDDARYQFYRGYILFKQGLVQDSLIRFERALRFVRLDDSDLFSNISCMLENCRALIKEESFVPASSEDKKLIRAHIDKFFGKSMPLCSLLKDVDILYVAPTEERDYSLLVSCGLSGKAMTSPDGSLNGGKAHLELCLPLPKDYRFKQNPVENWDFYLLLNLVRHVASSDDFIGFGYYISQDRPFSKATLYRAAMLIAVGAYGKEAQSVTLENGDSSFFYQVLPLLPMELNFRKHHSAVELLEIFKKSKIALTPFVENRPDVCSALGVN